MNSLLFFVALTSSAHATTATPTKSIQHCVLEDGSRIALLAQSEGRSVGDRFMLMLDGQTTTAFPDASDLDYTGDVVLATCVKNVLVFAINYGAPYYKGAAIRRTAANRAMHRIDFAEKGLPAWLYLQARETKLVIPNEGFETPARYLVYRYETTKGQDSSVAQVDLLPPTAGFRVVGIKRQAASKPAPSR